MNLTRSFRSLICLLLICCFLVHGMAPRAEATGLGALITGGSILVPAVTVIGSILVGIGIYQAYENSPALQNLVNTIKDKWTNDGIVNNDQIEVLQVAGGTLEDPIYAVPESLIEDALDQAYASGAVSVSEKSFGFDVAPDTFVPSIYGNDLSANIPTTCFVFQNGPTSYTFCLVATQPFTYQETGFRYDLTGSIATGDANLYTYKDQDFYYVVTFRTDDGGYGDFALPGPWYAITLAQLMLGEYGSPDISVDVADGLTAGQIATQGSSIAAGYPAWSANSFKYQDEEDMYYPVGLGSTYEETVSKTQEDVWAGMSEYTSEVLTNWQSLLNMLSAIKTAVTGLWGSISGWFANVIAEIAAIPDAFASWFEQMIEYGSSILDTLKGLAGSIADAIVEALTAAFALDEAYMRAEFDALLSDFKFLDSMVDFGRGVVDVFYGIGSKPPILYVDLDAAESEFDYGDRVVFLDLTWYERYKPYGDAIISSFLWAWFGWRLLHSLPGLINGSSGAVPHINFRKWGD